MCIRDRYRMNTGINRMKGVLKTIYIKSRIKHAIKVTIMKTKSHLLENCLILLSEYARNKKSKRKLCLKVQRFNERNLMRGVYNILQTKIRSRTLMRLLMVKGREKRSMTLKKRVLEGLSEYMKMNRLNRSKAQIASSIHTHYVLKHFLAKFHSIYSWMRMKRRLMLLQRQRVFKIFKEKALSYKIHKELQSSKCNIVLLSLIHICRCRRYAVCRSRWSPYH
eukprot:TRINITY_DN10957_c0_g2_i3.p1 TRINITY_DN10957_c0_g2~~TRINITY_DN10957_c0_g2_i3.p1  ORF type:complete len:222 (-),score=19.50 TRINITY_DN10957_c0_g2_i3:23-688(-)